MASELDLYSFAVSSERRPGGGEEDDWDLALLDNQSGENTGFLLSGMALCGTGRKGMTLAGWESPATWPSIVWSGQRGQTETMSVETGQAGMAW